MADIIKFDDTIEYKLKKAGEAYDSQAYDEALPLLFGVLKQDDKNLEARLLIARIYAEMTQQDRSTEAYVSVLADGYNEEAVKGIVTNLLCQGNFKDAKYYSETYKINFDFSDFLTVETPDGDVIYGGDDDDEEEDEAQKRRDSFRLIVSRKEKGGVNLIKDKNLFDMTVEDLSEYVGGATFNFGELMEKLLSFDGEIDDEEEELPEQRKTAVGFKQVYPVPSKDCEDIISRAYNLFTAGKAEESIGLLDGITAKNGRYYYLAQKNKVMCYLALNRLASMKTAAEEALKGLPNDFTLKCYYYMALKLLEEDDAADKLFIEIVDENPAEIIDNMVKLDVCRLALHHQGVLSCVNKILAEYPYQPQFLLLKGKAEYNLGNVKTARATFLEVLRLFPDNFEAATMLKKISSGESGQMTYGEIEMAIRRVKLMSEINAFSTDSRALYNYIRNTRNWESDIEYLLLNESDRNVHTIVTSMAGMLENVTKRLLLRIDASDYLKQLLITYYVNVHYPKKISVMTGKRLTTVELPRYGWEKNLTERVVMAADMAIADIIMNKPKPKQYVIALTSRMLRVSEYMVGETSDRETVRNLMDANDGVALKRAIFDTATHNVRKINPMTIQDENYLEYLKIFERIEDEYGI